MAEPLNRLPGDSADQVEVLVDVEHTEPRRLGDRGDEQISHRGGTVLALCHEGGLNLERALFAARRQVDDRQGRCRGRAMRSFQSAAPCAE